MQRFESDYCDIIEDILDNGELVEGRNGTIAKVFGKHLEIDMSDGLLFPLLEGRKIFYKGVFGELAAMLRGPKHIKDFERWGCNYWKQWAKPDGSISVDYGNAWLKQINPLIAKLKNFPNDRRMLIDGWVPENLPNLDLPCCHFLYQWFVRDGEYLDMQWYQRSCDTMIGLPSDIVLAALWNVIIANQVGLKPGRIKIILGDTHIYEEHFEGAREFITNQTIYERNYPGYELIAPIGMDMRMFEPSMMQITDYNPSTIMKFELKS